VTYVLAFAGFAILIILHEFGHFIAAKATGMRVERFFLFFPPALISKQRGETEYGIGAIPLGGFVKITGMNPDEELPPEVAPRGYYHQPVWKRIVVIGAGPAVNIALAFLIFFILSFGARDLDNSVGEIVPGSPAAKHLQAGDKIVSVNDRSYADLSLEKRLEKFSNAVAADKCPGKQVDGCLATKPVRLEVERDGRGRTISIIPAYDNSVKRMRIGFSYGSTPAEGGPIAAADRSVSFMWLVTTKTVGVFANLLDAKKREQVSGVVGSYEVTRQAIGFSAREALTLLAVISLSLGLINLFPFLPLDGGHIFWSLVEKVRGRPVPFRVMERASAVGFVLVIMLFFIGLTNDIGRLTGEGFSVR
jgi:regulator of sigma E protease